MADGFIAITNFRLLVKIIEPLRIENPQQNTDFDVFLEIDAVGVELNAVLVSNGLSVDASSSGERSSTTRPDETVFAVLVIEVDAESVSVGIL